MSHKAISWDFDGTLAFRDGLWSGCLLQVLHENIPNSDIALDDIRPLLKDGFPWHTPDTPHPELSSPGAWWEVVEGLLYRACLRLGIEERDARGYSHETHHRYLDVAGFQLFDDTLPVLEALHDDGWWHVILSNHVPELADLVDGLKLSHLVHAVVTSAVTGYEKPHPRAFELGRQAAGAPDEIWMVGDNVVADVQGAEAVGIPAILVRRDSGDAERGFDDLEGVRSFLTADRTTLSIRTARVDEAEAIFQVQRASALAAFSHIFDPEMHRFPDEIERERAKDYLNRAEATVLVADVDGRVVGLAVVEGAELVRLFVAPDRWGRGVGSRLHDAALDEMRVGGHGRGRLWVLVENHQARAFYERRGWTLDGRVRTSPFPPHPIAVGYAVELQPR